MQKKKIKTLKKQLNLNLQKKEDTSKVILFKILKNVSYNVYIN